MAKRIPIEMTGEDFALLSESEQRRLVEKWRKKYGNCYFDLVWEDPPQWWLDKDNV